MKNMKKANKKTKKKNKKDGDFMKVCVIAIFIIVPVYTFIHLILSFVAGAEIAPATSVGFFTFFAGEAGLLTIIKRMKNKNNNEDEEKGEEDAGECDTVDSFGDHSISD